MKKILIYLIIRFDKLYKKFYSEDKNKKLIEIINDYSERTTESYLDDFIEANWYRTTKELYNIINSFYNSKLSELIMEWNDEEIWKLKYLLVLLIDLKSNLINNKDLDEG